MDQMIKDTQNIYKDQNIDVTKDVCIYKDTRDAEIHSIMSKIDAEKEFVHKIEAILPKITDKKRTSKEFRGVISIKQHQIDCNENLLKIIEKIPDCITVEQDRLL